MKIGHWCDAGTTRRHLAKIPNVYKTANSVRKEESDKRPEEIKQRYLLAEVAAAKE